MSEKKLPEGMGFAPVPPLVISVATRTSGKGWRQAHYSNRHPIKFAQYCWCAKCQTLVNNVSTDHPNGVGRGPWTVHVNCHGDTHVVRLSEEAVKDYIEGNIDPVPTAYFDGEPRPLTRQELIEGDFKALNPGQGSQDPGKT